MVEQDEEQRSSGQTQDDSEDVSLVLLDLATRAKKLISELETFRDHLRSIRQEQHVEAAHFRSTVQSELSMLERLSKRSDGESVSHIARSSNLPFLESVWSAAKQSTHVTALHKRLYFNSPDKPLPQAMQNLKLSQDSSRKRRKTSNSAVTVDVVTNGGLIWIKLSLLTNNRLLFDLAKQGWQSAGSDDGSEDAGYSSSTEQHTASDPADDVPLLKAAKELCLAANTYRVRTKKPAVHILLPRVVEGEVPEVDAVLADCRAAGATLFCGWQVQRARLDDAMLRSMAPDPLAGFSDVLNIDCTILLALVSEFSHAKVSKEPWFHTALQRQVEIEGNENLLPTLLYPALGARRLVCTREAATRMREIVDTIGTPSEKARTAIMMGSSGSDDDAALASPAATTPPPPPKTQLELVREMQKWSAYPVPAHWQLPIEVVASDADGSSHAALPAEAQRVGARLTAINRSVFLHGWASRRTTVTSNRTVVRQIEADLAAYVDLDDAVWPQIWLCPTARSLVGKEKRGSAKKEQQQRQQQEQQQQEQEQEQRQQQLRRKETGAWPLPDPLRREEQRRNGLDVLALREGHAVEDRRPNGYPCDDVLEAKNASRRRVEAEADAAQ